MHIATRGLPQPDLTPKNFDDIKKCLGDCLGHDLCPKPVIVTLPTRVIDCNDPCKPRLLITKGSSSKALYTTLSYVWGEDQPHRTTAENLKKYQSGIDSDFIPATIQDAIRVTRFLGLRYLWVDSFCILQDSESDKAAEISKIHVYFRDSYITIIAASAGSVSQGFLQQTPSYTFPVTKLPYVIDDETVGTISVVNDDDIYPHYIDPDTGGMEQHQDPTSTRAWCLEERVLSPRRLIFRVHALRYECHTTSININGSVVGAMDGDSLRYVRYGGYRHPAQLPIFGDGLFKDTPERINTIVLNWHDLITTYTRRIVTRPKDKLLAFGGIAEHFRQLWTQLNVMTHYAAGVWTHQLVTDLLWERDVHDERGMQSLPALFRAPSWSWAAIDNGVVFELSEEQAEISVQCDVGSCEVILKEQSHPYGEVTAGMLVLTNCWVLHGFSYKFDHDSREYRFKITTKDGVEIEQISRDYANIIYDSFEHLEGYTDDIPILVSYLALVEPYENEVIDGCSHIGLALVPTPLPAESQTGVMHYRRIGFVKMTEDGFDSCKRSKMTLHIV
jgi:hypothetical protein